MRSTSATAVSSTSLTTTWSNSGALVSSNSALATRLAITSGASVPAFQFLDRRRHDEDGAGVGAEDAFEVDPSQHVDVEQNGMPFPPDAVEFAAQRAVAGAGIDLLPFDETLFVDRPAEFVGREEIVVHAVALRTARCTRSGRDREFQLGNPSEQLAHDGRLARTARSRKDDEFSHETGY